MRDRNDFVCSVFYLQGISKKSMMIWTGGNRKRDVAARKHGLNQVDFVSGYAYNIICIFLDSWK